MSEQNTHHFPQQDSILLLLGELRGDMKSVLMNQQRMSERVAKAEEKIEENEKLIASVKTRQAYVLGYGAGVGAVVSGLLMLLKDKLGAFIH